MLGNSTLQQYYAQADSITAKPKAIIEWNGNDLSKIQAFGQGDGTSSSFSFGTISTNGTVDDSFRFCFSAIINVAAMPFANVTSAQVTVAAVAKDSAGTIINQESKIINVYSTEVNDYFIDAFTYDPTKAIASVTLTALTNTVYEGSTMAVAISYTNQKMYKISQSETIKNGYTSVADVFSPIRPGEPYVDGVPSLNSNVSPYYLGYNNFIQGAAKDGRNFAANIRAGFKYHFYNTSMNGSFFAIYKNTFYANKVVIKVNNNGVVPSAVNIQTSADGSTWSGSNVSGAFSSNGLCVLYWNGSSWTTTAPTSIPSYSAATMPANVLTVKGIKASFTASSGEVHLVEISPRLELDVSEYVQSFSVTKELTEDSNPLPIGVSNSNFAEIQLSNIPEADGTVPFNQHAGALAGLFRKGPKVKLYTQSIDIDSQGTDVDTLIGTYNVDSWDFSDINSVSISAYDKIKILSTIPVPQILLKNTTAFYVISAILDNVGFTDYPYSDLDLIRDRISSEIPYFWTERGKNVLETVQEILTPYQISMYCDEYNAIRFKHISQISSISPSTTYAISDIDTYVDANGLSQTSGSGNSLVKVNIKEFSEIQEGSPSSITVQHTSPAPVEYNQATARTSLYRSVRNIDLWKPPNTSEYVGYINITSPISATEVNTIEYDFDPISSVMDTYTGYVLVGNEIIKFDGIEFTLTVISGTGTTSVSRVVRSGEELDLFKADLLNAAGVIDVGVTNVTPSNKIRLKNLTRGCFGTPVEAHSSNFNIGTEFILKSDIYSAADRKSGTRGNGVAFTATNSYLQMIRIQAAAGIENRYIALKNQTLTNEHRLFSGSFDLPTKTLLPSGQPVEFGLLIGATTGAADGLYVGVKVMTERKGRADIKLFESIIIQQYSAGTLVTDKEYRVYSERNALANTKFKKSSRFTNKQGSYINMYGNNTLSVFLANQSGIDDSTSGYSKAIVIINGSVITIENDEANSVQILGASGTSASYRYKMPAVSLSSPVNLSGKYFGSYSTGRREVSVNYLQAIGAVGDTNPQKNNINLLASVISGNSMGISNKSELDSVVFGRKNYDSYQVVEFRPQSIGREIKVFDVAYTGSPVVTYPVIIRSDYINDVAVTSNRIGTTRVPAESLTFSSIDHTPDAGRFAIINSYNAPVYINKPAGGPSGEQTTTVVTGRVLAPKTRGYVSSLIDRSGYQSSSVTIDSVWVQNETLANIILANISKFAIMKRSRLKITVFGNPLVSIGDVLYVQNTQRNLPTGKYIVTAVTHSISVGISTEITLRRIQE